MSMNEKALESLQELLNPIADTIQSLSTAMQFDDMDISTELHSALTQLQNRMERVERQIIRERIRANS
jgi:hypothetical protein